MRSLRQQPDWQRSIYAVMLAQVFVTAGYSFIFPFIPLYIQELGKSDASRAALWAAIALGLSGATSALSGPFWGALADRFGRKPMWVRSLTGGGLAVLGMGFAQQVWHIFLGRFIQGFFAGTQPAAMALVAGLSPKEKMGHSIGLMQTTFFLGTTIGPLAGGLIVQSFGIRSAFYVVGGGTLVVALVASRLVKESFRREQAPRERIGYMQAWRSMASKGVLPLLAMTFVIQGAPLLIIPALPIAMKEAAAGREVAWLVGLAIGLRGLLAAVASMGWTRVGAQIGYRTVLAVTFVGAGFSVFPLYFVHNVWLFVLFIAVSGLFIGGVLVSNSVLISRAVPRERAGSAFGALQSANASALAVAPWVSGLVAVTLGLKDVFLVATGAFTLAALLSWRLVREAQETPSAAVSAPVHEP